MSDQSIYKENLPNEGTSQQIGRLAKRALGVKLPSAWIEKELDGDTDFGIDYLIQLKNSNSDLSFSFYFQLKGTTVPEYSADRSYISYDFNVSTLRYYRHQEPLVMVGIVDLKDNEADLSKCPIYFQWLDDEWFSSNIDRLDSQKTISIRIPLSQPIHTALDVYEYYAKRIEEKLAVADLKRELNAQTPDMVQTLVNLTDVISEKPIFLKTVEAGGEEPWIENPKGEIPTILKQCSDSIAANLLTKAQGMINELSEIASMFSEHEHAEFHLQEATILARQGNDKFAYEKFKLAYEKSSKDRYKLSYLESKFRIEEQPTEAELQELAASLPVNEYKNAMLKAKCLVLLGRLEEALQILTDNHPERPLGQLIMLILADKSEAIDDAIENFDTCTLENDRERFWFHALIARRQFVVANKANISSGVSVHMRAYVNADFNGMKNSYENLVRAWEYAKGVGYPSDIIVLFDVSPFVFGYFNRLNDLFNHLDLLLGERPTHVTLIKFYSRLLFNDHQFEKTIDLLTRIDSSLDASERGMLVLSNYSLGRYSIALRILKDNCDTLLRDSPWNAAFVFSVGAEVARESLEDELAENYERIAATFDTGAAFVELSRFMRLCNAEPENRKFHVDNLYKTYIDLGKPLVIAEHLFKFLNPTNEISATQIIEVADQLILSYELREQENFRLAEALITASQFDAAIALANKYIEREFYDPHWRLVKAVCLEKIGRPGLAYDEIKASLNKNRFSNDYLKQYVHICVQFGLLSEVEESLKDLFSSIDDRDEKLRCLSTLIVIYFSQQGSEEKLWNSVARFGQLVDRDNCTEEGQFLIFFLMLPFAKDQEQIAEFQDRLAIYCQKFPDSKILWQGSIDTENGVDSLLSSINKMAGVTPQQQAKWEENKQKIRNGSLPVPFVMLERVLRDTRDLFTTWVLANNSGEGGIEYKLNQSPQLDQERCNIILSQSKALILEDTSILILNEIGLLDKLLAELDEIVILEMTFERINKNHHPLVGSIYGYIPKQILKVLNEHKKKLRILPAVSENPFELIKAEMIRSSIPLLSDDLYALRLITMGDNSIESVNTYNIIEYLTHVSQLSEEEKFNLIAKTCSLGIQQPNMSIRLLADALSYFTGVVNGIDYSDTEFKTIFDKVFSSARNGEDVFILLLDTLLCASENPIFPLNSDTLLSLFRGFLIRHQLESLDSLATFWFIYQCIGTSVKMESEHVQVSSTHATYWSVYVDMIYKIKGTEISLNEIMLRVVMQLFALDTHVRPLAVKNVKSCFIPLTQESDLYAKLLSEIAIKYRLASMRR